MIFGSEKDYAGLDAWLNGKKAMLVAGRSIEKHENLMKHLNHADLVRFLDFQPNPRYESVVEGVKLFRESKCNALIAVGGGSAMDVAKCVKLYSQLPGDGADGSFLQEKHIPNDIPFLAVPTTAGTGSEATRYAVIYYKDEKQSIADDSIIPSDVLMDAALLNSLPVYQRQATMLDALSHAIESFWSVNSTEESREYSRQAIRMIMENMDGYLGNTKEGNQGMLMAAHIAGQAINITQTTAGHAMCYKLTSLYGLAHGHAAALCNSVLFPWMLQNLYRCIDPRGAEYLKGVFTEIAVAFDCNSASAAALKFEELLAGMKRPIADEADYCTLKSSVNPVRLKNHPVALDSATIEQLYRKMLR